MIIGCRLALFSEGVDGQVAEAGGDASGIEIMIVTGVAPQGVVMTTEIGGGKLYVYCQQTIRVYLVVS